MNYALHGLTPADDPTAYMPTEPPETDDYDYAADKREETVDRATRYLRQTARSLIEHAEGLDHASECMDGVEVDGSAVKIAATLLETLGALFRNVSLETLNGASQAMADAEELLATFNATLKH